MSRQEVGKRGTELIKAKLDEVGFHISPDEVRQRSNQFQVRNQHGVCLTIQPKTISNNNYTFMLKNSVELSPDFYMALIRMKDAGEPELFLIPLEDWKKPNALLADKPYEGLKSPPEWGVRVSGKNMELLQKYNFAKMVEVLQDKKS